MISSEQKQLFEEQGFLLLEGFYDVAQDIEPLQRAIHRIIGLVIDKYHPDISHQQEPFDSGYIELITRDRRLGGVIYDAVKQLPEFVQLSSSKKNVGVMKALRDSETIGIARSGDGIRINNPHEPEYMAPWHQEFPSQFRSLDGVVFWSPLHAITSDMGAVEICVGSHKQGIRPVYYENQQEKDTKGSAYGLAMWEAEKAVAPYEKIAPLTKAGDLLLMDFLTLHQSGYNSSKQARWSMQLRYFNFEDATGREIDWSGGFLSGKTIDEVMPSILKKEEDA